MAIELVKFKAEHWMVLNNDTSEKSALHGTIREKAGIAYTAMDGEWILGCAGIITESKTGILWALLTEDIKRRYPLWFHRTARGLLMPVIETLGLVRVEAIVDPAIKMNCRWIEKLGFQNKRIKEKAGPDGKDVLEYVLLR